MQASLRRFSLPLVEPVETPAGRVERREGVLVGLEADGHVGIGEATPLAGWTEPLTECVDALQGVVNGGPLSDLEAVIGELEERPAARYGLTLAVADLEARRSDRPLYRRLGAGGHVEAVAVNATVGRGDVAATVEAAREAVDAGFDCIKVKAGGRPVEADARRLAAVRDVAGPAATLRVDANGAWSREEAERALPSLADAGVAYVEQPLPGADLEGLSALRGGPVGVAVDETLAHTGPAAVVEAGAADVLVVKPMAHGGLDRASEVVELAASAGLEAVVTTTVDGVVARLGAVHLTASLEEPLPAGLATARYLAEDLAPDPSPIAEGRARVPAAAGHGVEVDWS